MSTKCWPVMTLAVALCLGSTPLSVAAQNVSLVNLLMQQLGVTQPQAEGGAGAIFNLAKETLSPPEFSQVAQAVPNMDQLLAAAPQKPSSLGGMLGSGSSLFGGVAKDLEGMAGVTSAFSKLGLSPDMVSQFSQIILSFVQGNGGEATKNLLASVLSSP